MTNTGLPWWSKFAQRKWFCPHITTSHDSFAISVMLCDVQAWLCSSYHIIFFQLWPLEQINEPNQRSYSWWSKEIKKARLVLTAIVKVCFWEYQMGVHSYKNIEISLFLWGVMSKLSVVQLVCQRKSCRNSAHEILACISSCNSHPHTLSHGSRSWSCCECLWQVYNSRDKKKPG